MGDSIFSLTETPLPAATLLAEHCGPASTQLAKDGKTTRVWRLVAAGKSYFAKAGPTQRLQPDLLIGAAKLHRAIPPLVHSIKTSDGILLIFEFVAGAELSGPPRQRFFALPLRRKLAALADMYAAKLAIVENGWILEDFYEGNVIYNFATGAVWVCDFEFYQRGPSYILQRDMTYGSSRLRPPEEYCKGERIDQRANVFTLGRYGICALSTQIEQGWRNGFQGSAQLAEVLEQATQPDRQVRYARVRDFVDAFGQAAK